MDQTQRIKIIQSLIPYLTKHNAGVTVQMSYDVQLDLKAVYKDIFKINQVNTSCGACVVNYINMLLAWYEREYPIWLESQKPVEEIAPVEQEKQPAGESVKKPIKNKKKK